MPRRRATNIRATRGLDLLNFFIAGEQTGFGPFIAVYLTARQWSQGEIGFALSLGTITAMISQVPAGLLVDALRNKRVAVAAGVLAVGVSALLLAAWPALLPVLAAQAAARLRQLRADPGDCRGQPGAGRARRAGRADRTQCALRGARQRAGGRRNGPDGQLTFQSKRYSC